MSAAAFPKKLKTTNCPLGVELNNLHVASL